MGVKHRENKPSIQGVIEKLPVKGRLMFFTTNDPRIQQETVSNNPSLRVLRRSHHSEEGQLY